jgi:threonyl-tRNA synthetase
MTEDVNKQEHATLFLGCPEVPVQMGISLYLSHMLRKSGRQVTIAANPSVIKLARVADPERHYMDKMIDLDRCIGDIAEKKRSTDIAILFAHNDAGITYAATVRYLHPGRMVLVLFGRHAEELVSSVDFPCEMIVEKAVHDPAGLKKKIDEVFQWPA